MEDISNLTFYHPDLKHDQVRLLMTNYGNKRGIYLMRDSREGPKTKTISVMHRENLLNFRITIDTKVHVGEIAFDNIFQLVQHFSKNSFTNDKEFTEVYLKEPICRVHGLSSWNGMSLECCTPSEGIYMLLKDVKLNNHYHNKNTCKLNSETSLEDIFDTRVVLQNNWNVVPMLMFKDPQGNIHPSMPNDVWINITPDEMAKIKKLRQKFPIADDSSRF